MTDKPKGFLKKLTEHPVLVGLAFIGIWIAVILVVNIMTAGMLIYLSQMIVGCSDHCSKIQWLGVAIINIIISSVIALIWFFFEEYRKHPDGFKFKTWRSYSR